MSAARPAGGDEGYAQRAASIGRVVLRSLLAALVAIAACVSAPADPEARTQWLGRQLRCPICRGVAIADSPSELSNRMMATVREQVAGGKSDAEILRWFETRYGEWVLLQPKAEGMNLLVWILPAAFLVGGAAVILARARRRG